VREAPALLQGRVLCGLCGERMGVHYSQEHGCIVPVYICQENIVRRGGRVCQTVPGKIVDPAIGALIVELMTPMTLGVTLAVQQELEARDAETDALRRQHVERLRYEADLARRRYMKVDPDNRLVADALEAEWNDKLRGHSDALVDYERRSRDQVAALDEQARRRILDLAEEFPAIWNDPRVEPRDRKRILRLLVEDVTLVKAEVITAHVRLRGGATRSLRLERPLPIAQIRKFKPELIAEVDRLLDRHCDREIADILNQRGCRTWEAKPFDLKKIAFIRTAYKLPSRYERAAPPRHVDHSGGRRPLRRLQNHRPAVGPPGIDHAALPRRVEAWPLAAAARPDHPEGLRRKSASPSSARSHHRASPRMRCSMKPSLCRAAYGCASAGWLCGGCSPASERCGRAQPARGIRVSG
jgi:hypothetical protein